MLWIKFSERPTGLYSIDRAHVGFAWRGRGVIVFPRWLSRWIIRH